MCAGLLAVGRCCLAGPKVTGGNFFAKRQKAMKGKGAGPLSSMPINKIPHVEWIDVVQFIKLFSELKR
jgi:hypothetical protein